MAFSVLTPKVMFEYEKDRLKTLRAEAAEREALEQREAEEISARQAALDNAAARIAARRFYEQSCIDGEIDRQRLNREKLPSLPNSAAYHALPVNLRVKYVKAFGENYLATLEQRSKCGLSESDWSKLQSAEPLPRGVFDPLPPADSPEEIG